MDKRIKFLKDNYHLEKLDLRTEFKYFLVDYTSYAGIDENDVYWHAVDLAFKYVPTNVIAYEFKRLKSDVTVSIYNNTNTYSFSKETLTNLFLSLVINLEVKRIEEVETKNV